MSELPELAEVVEPRRSAVLVVDVQNDFCESEAAQAMLPRLRAFIDAARREGVTIIRIKTVHSDKTNTPVWVSRFVGRSEKRLTCQEGLPGGDFAPGFEPVDGDIVVIKHRYSAFIGTDLEMILRARRIETVLCTGLVTNVCVESTARDAFQRDFWTVTVPDCAAASTEAAHQAALENLKRQFGRLADSQELVATWQSVSVPVAAH